MRDIARIALLATACHAVSVSAAETPWTSTGPEGGTIAALVVDPDRPETVYAATHGGVFRSTDGGEHWTRHGANPPSHARGLALVPGTPVTLWAATGDGVARTTGDGETWRESSVPNERYTIGVAVASDGTVYAVARLGELSKTVDGETWTPLAPLDPSAQLDVLRLVVDPVVPGALYVSTESGRAFRSVDGGASWTDFSLAFEDLVIDPTPPRTLYAATRDGVRSSIDDGLTWSEPLLAEPVVELRLDPRTSETLHALGHEGVWVGTQRGAQWTRVGAFALDWTPLSLAVAPVGPTTWFAGTAYDGIFRLSAPEDGWQPSNSGLVATYINALVVDPRTPTTAYAALHNGVARTTDGGASWTTPSPVFDQYGFPGISALAIDPATPTTLFAGTRFGSVLGTVDAGEHWTLLNDTFGDVAVTSLTLDPAVPNRIFATTRAENGPPDTGGVFRSDDGGVSWQSTDHPRIDVDDLAIDPRRPSRFIAVGDAAARSRDGGEKWTETEGDWPTWRGGAAVCFDGRDRDTLYGVSGYSVRRSTNGGRSWARFPVGPPFLASSPESPVVWAGNGLRWSIGQPFGLTASRGDGCWMPIDASLGDGLPTLGDGLPFWSVVEGAILGDEVLLYLGTPGHGVHARRVPAVVPDVPAPCAAQPVPRRVRRGLESGCRLMVRGFAQDRDDPEERLFTRAAQRWRRASDAIDGANLSEECASTLRAMMQ